VDSAGLGSFSNFITGLVHGTTYYVRAYATNQIGTAYGQEETFTTYVPPCGIPFTDPRDGNIYNTIMLADQCWMQENLRYLPEVFPINTNAIWAPRYYVYGYNGTDTAAAKQHSINGMNIYNTYGVLYNWTAVMQGSSPSNAIPSGVQGICPPGWHVPSDSAWQQLEMSLGMSQADAALWGHRGTNQGSRLAGTDSLWLPGALTADAGFGNSGFKALPAGLYGSNVPHLPHSNYGFLSEIARFATATAIPGCPQHPSGQTNNVIRNIRSSATAIRRYCGSDYQGISLRCVRD